MNFIINISKSIERFVNKKYIIVVIVMFLQSLIITFLLEKAHFSESFKILNMLPFVRSLMDIIENCFILGFIFNYPVRVPALVRISSVFTNLKWVTYGLIIALLILLLLIIMFKATIFTIRKWSEEI
jgi:hypothetical protein